MTDTTTDVDPYDPDLLKARRAQAAALEAQIIPLLAEWTATVGVDPLRPHRMSDELRQVVTSWERSDLGPPGRPGVIWEDWERSTSNPTPIERSDGDGWYLNVKTYYVGKNPHLRDTRMTLSLYNEHDDTSLEVPVTSRDLVTIGQRLLNQGLRMRDEGSPV